MRLFYFLNLHFMLRRRLQTALCLLGIALGVGVVVAIDVANASALHSFQDAVDVVAGKATQQIQSKTGGEVDEQIFPAVLALPGVIAAAPIIERPIAIQEAGGEALKVLGVDPFLDGPFRSTSSNQQSGASPLFLTAPKRIVIPRTFADRHRLKTGGVIHAMIGTKNESLTIHGMFDTGEMKAGAASLAIMDIAGAQELFAMTGKLDRIDLILKPDAEAAVAQILPPDAEVVRPDNRTRRIEDMIASFRMNLMALSLLAVFVGTFLIFNTLTFSVIQRRRQIGIFRCIGMTRKQVAGLFLAEALVLGIIGSALGIGLGLGFATYTLKSVTRTISDLYTQVSADGATIHGLTILKAFCVGVCASLCAAILPAIEAANVPPTAAVSRPEMDIKVRRRAPMLALAGVGTLAGAFLLAVVPGRSVIPGFAGAFLIQLGFALVSPLIAMLFAGLAKPVARTVAGMPGLLGVRNITASLSRTGTAIAALMVSLSMLIGVTLMVRSFRQSLIDWIGQTIKADIYVIPMGRRQQKNEAFLPPDFLEKLRGDPDIVDLDKLRQRQITVKGQPANLNAVKFDLKAPSAKYEYVEGDADEATRELRSSDSVIISETLRLFTGIHKGDNLELPTPGGTRSFKVAGVYRDYSADGGQVLMHRDVYVRAWKDPQVNNAAIYLKPGINPEEKIVNLKKKYSHDYTVMMRSNAGLRYEVLKIFDNTFAITYVMQALSMVVAVCGILSALLALILERTRELGTLRTLGMTFPQLSLMLYVESATIGFIASVVGCIAGIPLAMLLVYVINVRSFGWTIDFHLSADVFLTGILLSVASALLAAVYPNWRLKRLSLAAAMRVE